MTESSAWDRTELREANRGQKLLGDYYKLHHQRRRYDFVVNEETKAQFFSRMLAERWGECSAPDRVAVDLGCRGGALTSKLLNWAHWLGVDVDPAALAQARDRGIDCREMDLGLGLAFKNDSFDLVMMTEVLEHLPYPIITLAEINRILRKQPDSVFLGSVPIDYHLRRRLAVLAGRRLEGDPTHIHSFSVREISELLHHYFSKVVLHFQRTPHWPWKLLPARLSAIDVFWAAWEPKADVPMADIELRHQGLP